MRFRSFGRSIATTVAVLFLLAGSSWAKTFLKIDTTPPSLRVDAALLMELGEAIDSGFIAGNCHTCSRARFESRKRRGTHFLKFQERDKIRSKGLPPVRKHEPQIRNTR